MHHRHIDQYAQGSSIVHRLDARGKGLALIAYLFVLISFHRYAVSVLAPLAIGPLAMLVLSGVPLGFAFRRVLVLSPFIMMLCLLSPWYDRSVHLVAVGPWRGVLAGGWLTAADVAIKFALGVLALTAVVSATPFALLLEAMRKLGMPRLLVMQLGLLYRYLFVLVDEAMRIRRARDFRGGGLAPVSRRLAAVGGIVGQLFVRALDRSERIHVAMEARGFDGQTHSLSRLRGRAADAVFLAVVACYLAFCRWLYPMVLFHV